MSMVLRPEIAPEKAVLITTCAAVAVARAIGKVCGLDAGIKWVNDIFIDRKKVCGILAEAEMNPETATPEYVILGIGINVKKQSVPVELKEIVGCLEDYGMIPEKKEELMVAVWKEFGFFYETLSTAVYMKEYKERSILLGREVTVFAATGEYRAVVSDIDEEGHLIIERDGMLQRISSGEVSVRL